MLRIPASAPCIAARLRTAARRTPPAHQYSTAFGLYFSFMSGFLFCAALFAVPTLLPVTRSLAAPSAPVGAPLLRHPSASAAEPIPSAGGSPLCPPSPHSPLPPAVSLPFPAHLCPSSPFLLSLCPSQPPFYHPLPSPTPRVHLSCSPPRFSSARPSCTPLAPGPWRTSVGLLPRPTPPPRTTPPLQ